MKKIYLLYVVVILLLHAKYVSGEKLIFTQQPLNDISTYLPDDRFRDSTEVERLNKSIEPILTEETLPNEVGEWDLRFIFDYFKNDEVINAALPQVQLFFGIFENLGGEISLPLNYSKVDKVEYGLGSISTSVKWLLINQSHTIPAVVFGLEVGFPTNSLSEETEERAFELSPYIAFLKDFGQLCVQGNIARSTEFPVSGGEKNYRTDFNIAFSYPIFGEKVDVLAELSSSWLTMERNELFVSPGIKYNLNDEDCIALAVPLRLNNRRSNFRIIFQYQLEL
ncbi:MAG: hypothetical protein Q8N83_03075 [Ignavibacteria bacterium]|nr:hypothetical protein [Ignavibacteria bacterium]